MANEAFLVSTAVMGLLLVGAALATGRAKKRENYRPRLDAARAGLVERGDASRTLSNAVFVGIVALLAVFVGSILLGNPALGFVVVTLAVIAAYFAWGVYNIARVRGLPVAHAVGLSAWMFGVVLVFGVAVKLLFG